MSEEKSKSYVNMTKDEIYALQEEELLTQCVLATSEMCAAGVEINPDAVQAMLTEIFELAFNNIARFYVYGTGYKSGIAYAKAMLSAFVKDKEAVDRELAIFAAYYQPDKDEEAKHGLGKN